MSRIGMSMLASKGKVPDVRKVDIYFCKPGSLGKQKNLSFIMSLKTRKLQSRSCGRSESTGLCAEAPKILWADSVSTTYLIYRIPYVLIGLRIPEEKCQGLCADSSSFKKPIQKSQVVLVDIPGNLCRGRD
ncbi:hypothetical protein Tco_0514468 [Tanacetum coccineum]